MSYIKVTDADIQNAVREWTANHADAPTEAELCELRRLVGRLIDATDPEMLSLHWLRNRFVALRKSKGLKVRKPNRPALF